MTLRVVVIGTGFGARVVAPVLASTAGLEVVAVVSPRDDDGIDAALGGGRVDIVSVHSPPFLHGDHVRRALGAGVRAVLCDKPLARDPAEAAALRDDADAAGVQHFVNFEFRQDPARRALAAWVRDGAIGEVRHVVWTHHSAGTRVPLRPYGWLFDASLGGGWIGAWASHAVDTLRWMFGGDVTVVWSAPRIDIARRADRDGVVHECTAEDGVVALLRLASGASVTIDSTFAAAANLPPRLLLFGDDGVIEDVADQRVGVRRADGTREEHTFEGEPTAGHRDRHLLPMQRWAEVVRDCVNERVTPPSVPTFADGAAVDAVLAQLRQRVV
jgi:predicted dehydrogenase